MCEKPSENEFNFPFKPYRIQVDLMRSITRALDERKIGLFSSPTGTGKSLSLICACFSWLKNTQETNKNHILSELNELKAALRQQDLCEKNWVALHCEQREKRERIAELEHKLQSIREFEERNKQLKQRKKSNISISKSGDYKKRKTDDDKDDCESDIDELLVNYDSDTEFNEPEDNGDERRLTPCIIYSSRTHSQLTQFINEVKATEFKDKVRVVALASRSNLCVNSALKKVSDNNLINEKCLDLQKKAKKCPYFKQSIVNEVRDLILGDIHDIEDVASIGRNLKACSYYASKFASSEAELLVVPYNVLLHKQTRNSYGISLRDNIVIIDEAHNLLETIASINSAFINGGQIIDCHSRLNQYLIRYNSRLNPKNLMYVKQIIFILNSLLKILKPQNNKESEIFTTAEFVIANGFDNINLFKVVNYCENSQLARKLHAFSSSFQQVTFQKVNGEVVQLKSGTNAFLSRMKAQQKKRIQKTEPDVSKTLPLETEESNVSEEPQFSSSSFYQIIEFFRCLTNPASDGRVVVHRISSAFRNSTLKFILLNPSNQFQEVVDQSRSVILIGGTMEPFNEFIDHLLKPIGVNEDKITCFSCGHIIPDNNLLPICLGHGPSKDIAFEFSFKYRNNSKVILEAGESILRLCSVIPGGIIVFFPSYEYENKVFNIWTKNGYVKKFEAIRKRVFRELSNSTAVNTILTEYKRTVKLSKGALLFSVVGGKMSEGINFADDFGRAVVMIGLPFPNITAPEIKEKMSFYENMKRGDGQKFYLNSCMKAVNQSIGRVIRHSKDYATIILLDQRFCNRNDVKNSLPSWIRDKLRTIDDFDVALDAVKCFFKEK
ncbi:putative ATP-dependent RNA helicase DDX11-like protein [Dinothrombium tinctorium]|uniref:Putative ATP-dependent RNA helicase DDX11-like protein n=1 Tax=Dinothrombium tinctorium TaxID=1965070 RepID=A0A3S3P3A7_9ACAR|nr:putative ATP-dependent RNA helicase DDX11-like protein [Dinothrombium tinctorium]RWS11155.1 putative ATP-dependent RNA helicase DDX11-like protein [Dinothrombium tinctorium]